GWDSPWGRGRPGWHIECSAMAKAHLGVTFDIHGGGLDLIFPHHENEIAQSVCANQAPFVRTWMHNGFVTVNGEKMSKSLGNFLTIRDALAQHPGEAIRLATLKSHYRQPFDWTDQAMREARANLDGWYRQLDGVAAGTLPDAFVEAMDDDLNTPRAFAVMQTLAAPALRACLDVLGFCQRDAAAWFQAGGPGGLDETAIEAEIERRKAAKQAKDFALADRIRAELAEQGVVLEDKPGGVTVWRRGA
ncbi:MAG: DALR domain-containing protein, partial [Ferrovibrionaceae bacterium]